MESFAKEDLLALIERTSEAKETPVREPPKITIDKNICKKCYNCVRACTVAGSVYEIGEDGYPYAARPELCVMCLMCHVVCPARAIRHEGIRRITLLVLDRDIVERAVRIY